MLIKITINDLEKNQRLDVQVDNEQRIKTTLRVLNENMQNLSTFTNIKEVRMKDTGRRIAVEKTYLEAGIYSGTEILIPAPISNQEGATYNGEL